MKRRSSIYWIGIILVLFSLQVTGYLTPLISRLAGSPWWIYLVIAGVIFSGFQFFSISKEEEEIDQKFIEAEGRVYIDRIEEERLKKKGEENKKNAV